MADSVTVTDVRGVLNIPLSVHNGNDEEVKTVCLYVRPQWKNSDVAVKYMPGGSVNYIYICHLADDVAKSDALIVRIFGGMEKTLSREKEMISMRIAHACGCAKPVYASFNNGVIYGFAVGKVPIWDDFWNPEIARPVIKSLAQMNSYKDIERHCVNMDGQHVELERTPCFTARMWGWLKNLPKEFVNCPEKEARYKAEVKSYEELENEIHKLNKHLESFNFPVVYSHGDVWVANFVFNKEENRNYLIDFEFSAFNYEGFDLATFLSSFNFQDIIEKGAGPTLPLTREMSVELTRYYLEAILEFANNGPVHVTDEELQKYYLKIRVLDIACRFYWGLCALTLADCPDVKRIDILHFALSRFKQYEEDREEMYSIKPPT